MFAVHIQCVLCVRLGVWVGGCACLYCMCLCVVLCVYHICVPGKPLSCVPLLLSALIFCPFARPPNQGVAGPNGAGEHGDLPDTLALRTAELGILGRAGGLC